MTPQIESNTSAIADPAVRAALRLLSDGASLLERISDEQYTLPSPALRGATVGQHIRHTLDHFSAILSSLSGEPIRYDQRKRGTVIETSRSDAMDRVGQLSDALGALDSERSGVQVTVVSLLNPDDPETELESTLARELAFATHHATHHHAMILVAAEAMGVELPADFGRAPATVRHDRTTG
ncbi:MAG: hypothetical protein EA376_05800 [Phycisphaeraceae bacterium]|nr:MAG: hypothetical protein EA376_05800 [Phycisphaeraceae bacterium]